MNLSFDKAQFVILKLLEFGYYKRLVDCYM